MEESEILIVFTSKNLVQVKNPNYPKTIQWIFKKNQKAHLFSLTKLWFRFLCLMAYQPS